MKLKLSKVQRVVEVVEGRVMGEEELKKIFNESDRTTQKSHII